MNPVIWVVRGLFVVAAVFISITVVRAYQADATVEWFAGPYDYWAMLVGLAASSGVVALDILFRKKSVAVVLAITFGLVVGALVEFLVVRVIGLAAIREEVIPAIELALLALFCYMAVAIVLQTREDFHFVIPYVRFSAADTETPPFILDTSVIIDGRIADISDTGILENPLVVPRFVLNELHGIADSADRLKRTRGRRGLDILKRLQDCTLVTVHIRDMLTEDPQPVDAKLIQMAKTVNGRVVTNDFNLNKIAHLQGVEVVNINDLARALRPVVLPGEELEVKVIRPGEEAGQGVGYLEDGTMVVVEQGRAIIGQSARIVVNNVYQTSAGRMIFGKPADTEQEKKS